MDDVMSRKKAYLGIRLEGEAPPPIASIKRGEEHDFAKKLELKYSQAEHHRSESSNRGKWSI